MAALFYKVFVIIATGQFDKERKLWMPVADISWHSAATARESHIIKGFTRLGAHGAARITNLA